MSAPVKPGQGRDTRLNPARLPYPVLCSASRRDSYSLNASRNASVSVQRPLSANQAARSRTTFSRVKRPIALPWIRRPTGGMDQVPSIHERRRIQRQGSTVGHGRRRRWRPMFAPCDQAWRPAPGELVRRGRLHALPRTPAIWCARRGSQSGRGVCCPSTSTCCWCQPTRSARVTLSGTRRYTLAVDRSQG